MPIATVTEKDLFKAQQLHAKPNGAKTLLLILVLVLVGFYLYDEAGVAPWVLVGGILGFLGFYIVFLKYKCAKIYRQQRNLQIPFQFSWDNEGIYMKNDMGEGRIKWSDFIKHKQNKSLILLYHSDVLFNIVPKPAFTDEQQLSDFSTHFEKIHD